MTLNEYQSAALKTAVYPEHMRIVYPALGLNGEAGEVADKVKKVYRDFGGSFSPERRKEIAMELGDVLWYVAVMAHDIGFSLNDIGTLNNIKLESRAQRGMISGNGDNR